MWQFNARQKLLEGARRHTTLPRDPAPAAAMRPSAALKAVALVACAAGAAAWNPTPPLEGLKGALGEVGEAAQYVQGLAEEMQEAETFGITGSVDVEELVASLKPAKLAGKLNQ